MRPEGKRRYHRRFAVGVGGARRRGVYPPRPRAHPTRLRSTSDHMPDEPEDDMADDEEELDEADEPELDDADLEEADLEAEEEFDDDLVDDELVDEDAIDESVDE